MKRHIMFVIMILMTVFMIGCNDSSKENNENTTETNDSSHPDEVDSEIEYGKEYENELGNFTVSYMNKDLSEKSESGPIELEVNGLLVNDIKIKEEHHSMLDGKEEGTLIIFNLHIVNTSDERVYFFTNDAEVETDSGEVVGAEKMLSELVGDPIDGGDSREGTITFLLDPLGEAINELKLTFDSAENTENESLGDPMTFTFNLNDEKSSE